MTIPKIIVYIAIVSLLCFIWAYIRMYGEIKLPEPKKIETHEHANELCNEIGLVFKSAHLNRKLKKVLIECEE